MVPSEPIAGETLRVLVPTVIDHFSEPLLPLSVTA
jgi:hypothetical protein